MSDQHCLCRACSMIRSFTAWRIPHPAKCSTKQTFQPWSASCRSVFARWFVPKRTCPCQLVGEICRPGASSPCSTAAPVPAPSSAPPQQGGPKALELHLSEQKATQLISSGWGLNFQPAWKSLKTNFTKLMSTSCQLLERQKMKETRKLGSDRNEGRRRKRKWEMNQAGKS